MNGNSRSHNENTQSEIIAALIGLGKLFKAVRFYPTTHPALKNTCNDTRKLFTPLLQQGNLTLTVHKTGFFLDEEPVGSELPILKDLAFAFFARMVKRLLFLPELTARDLEAFARCTVNEPGEIQRAGGLQEMLLRAHATTLFVNEIDLQKVKAYREQILIEQGADPAELDANTPEQLLDQETEELLSPELLMETLQAAQLDPKELLRHLEKEVSDQRYRLLCEKLAEILPEHLHEPDLATPRKALLLLARHGADKNRSKIQRRACLDALNRLGRPELLKFFINALCDKHQHSAGRDGIIEALTVLQEKAATALVKRLATEDNSQVRKLLSEALVKLDNCAAPVLLECLADKHWYITRNAIAILGRIQNRKTAIHIRPYVDHRDYRVRREAVRALGSIGGPIALKELRRLVDNRDRELCPLALIALGTMQDDAAVEPLLNMLKTFDPLLKQLELKKGAIKALGAIGSPQALPGLTKILGRRRLWKRNQYNKLRSCAAQALGNIASEEAIPSLENASNDSSPPVAHAAREALEKIGARTNHEP